MLTGAPVSLEERVQLARIISDHLAYTIPADQVQTLSVREILEVEAEDSAQLVCLVVDAEHRPETLVELESVAGQWVVQRRSGSRAANDLALAIRRLEGALSNEFDWRISGLRHPAVLPLILLARGPDRDVLLPVSGDPQAESAGPPTFGSLEEILDSNRFGLGISTSE